MKTRLSYKSIESFSNDDDDSGNENVKKAIKVYEEKHSWKQEFAGAKRFFVHFFAVSARLRENA